MSKLSTYRSAVDNLGLGGLFQRGIARRTALGSSATIGTRWSDHALRVRGGTSDMAVFDQIFMEREYRCLDQVDGVRTIVDAGANVGYSSAYLLSRFTDATVICLEPDKANFVQLQRNLAPFGDRVTAVQGALWSEPCTLNFKTETLADGKEWGRQVEQSGSGDVQAFDIPSVMKMVGFEEIHLLKIDIEGAERAVFSAPDLDWLRNVRNIVVELHGQECRSIFLDAIGDRYALSECGELTVCLSRSS